MALVAIPVLWSVFGHVDTMAHEGAHALLAAILGIELIEVVIKRNQDGATRFHPVGWGLRILVVAFVGYLGPSLFGLGAAKLISTGHVIAVLWVAIVLLVALFLFLIRGSFGLVTVPVAVLLLVLVMRYAHTGLEEIVVYVLTWLLLLAGVRTAFAHGAKAQDAVRLRQAFFLPRHLWSLLWIMGTVAALCVGGKWLVLG